MGNQSSAQISSNSLRALSKTKGNILSFNSDVKCNKSDINVNKRISSYSDEQMINDLKDMNQFNARKKDVTQFPKNSIDEIEIPTVFHWKGKAKEVLISGSFNNWKENIMMKKSENAFYTIINCKPGHYSYKFFVDGVWVHDVTQPTEGNPFGTLNNWIDVIEEDFDIDLSLSYDEKHSKKTIDGDYNENPLIEYGQDIPLRPNLITGMTLNTLQPRILPPYLSETILNIEVAAHNDPALLITPYHVQINHLYASSISSGIASLSVTVRYRSKYITTLFYKPISE